MKPFQKCVDSRRGSKLLIQFSYNVKHQTFKSQHREVTLKPVQTNVDWFDAVEGIILLPTQKQRFLGIVSTGYFYFLEVLG